MTESDWARFKRFMETPIGQEGGEVSEKDHRYIEMFRFGRDRIVKGVRFSEISAYLKEKGHEFDRDHLARQFDATFDFDENPGGGWEIHVKNDSRARISIDSYFRLLEHEELQEARQSSADAKRMAFWAIAISGALAAGSIWLQVYQIFFANS